MPSAELLDHDIVDLFHNLFETTTEPILVVNPSRTEFNGLITAAIEFEGDLSELRVLTDEQTPKDIFDDFVTAGHAADLIADGRLSPRSTEDIARSSLLITADQAIPLVEVEGDVTGFQSDDPELVERMRTVFSEEWENADEVTLRTPPLSQVRETMREDIGEDAADDFDQILDAVETVDSDSDLDEVTICLLVAARNEVLLYDISKWGEDVSLASKATFSRTKTRLEDNGIIDTEKVPIEVGRPRLRLRFADEQLQDASIDEMLSEVRTQLEA
ncbi:transcriptional regulator TbsP [Halomicrococcus sp. SG-WS-1]|uniref:transcriptional regulator TbsP n=1 Tax=Halomicrococcus sp. SG-WS-1 TaxID=3439057 RepID=UPI003F78D637